MTNEKAISTIENAKNFAYDDVYEEAFNMAINALKQKSILSVLDMIRTEIKAKIIKKPWFDFTKSERDRNDAFFEVLDIINRYKAEIIEKEE